MVNESHRLGAELTEAENRIILSVYAAIEEDAYAWREEMREAIARAQDLIDA